MTIRRRLALWGPVVAVMAVIFVLSAQPDVSLPDGLTDKQGHSLGYAGLGGLVARALAGGLGSRLTFTRAAASVVMTTVYGASDEWHQSFVPGRVADLADLRADLFGGVLGTVACWAWGIIRSRSDV